MAKLMMVCATRNVIHCLVTGMVVTVHWQWNPGLVVHAAGVPSITASVMTPATTLTVSMTTLTAKIRKKFASEFTSNINKIILFSSLWIWEDLSWSYCFCYFQSNIWSLLYRPLCWWTVWPGLQHRGVWMGWIGLCSEGSRSPCWWCLGFGCPTASRGASPLKHSFSAKIKCDPTYHIALSAWQQWRSHDPPLHSPRGTPQTGVAASTGNYRVSQAYSINKSCSLLCGLYIKLNIYLSAIPAAP